MSSTITLLLLYLFIVCLCTLNFIINKRLRTELLNIKYFRTDKKSRSLNCNIFFVSDKNFVFVYEPPQAVRSGDSVYHDYLSIFLILTAEFLQSLIILKMPSVSSISPEMFTVLFVTLILPYMKNILNTMFLLFSYVI